VIKVPCYISIYLQVLTLVLTFTLIFISTIGQLLFEH
jgi:hypothetical protein